MAVKGLIHTYRHWAVKGLIHTYRHCAVKGLIHTYRHWAVTALLLFFYRHWAVTALFSFRAWLDLFNVELSPKRCWREPRSLEVGKKGDCT